jgi:hypothetical protein
VSMRLAELESQLQSARSELEAARQILNDARVPLDAAERDARAAWARKKSALASLNATRNAALACGLSKSASVLASEARFQARIQAASGEIRTIVSASHQVCDIFEWAWDSYLAARVREGEILNSMIECAAEVRQAASEGSDTGEIESTQVHKMRLQLAQSLANKEREKQERRSDLSLPDEAHYDPQYDDREILERRMRPWV